MFKAKRPQTADDITQKLMDLEDEANTVAVDALVRRQKTEESIAALSQIHADQSVEHRRAQEIRKRITAAILGS